MSNSVSVVMIVKNGGATIRRSLESAKAFAEIVVYDNGSTDDTIEIAKSFPNVRLIQGEFRGFGDTKNAAVSQASHDWVVILDSDEAIEPGLANKILTMPLDTNTLYLLNFKAFYKERQIKHCGWNNQKIRRLFHRRATRFTRDHVHENLIDAGMTIQEVTGGSVCHYSYHSISDFIIKVDRYSTLFAEHNAGKKSSSPLRALINGMYSFFRTYVLKRGFLDGYVGLVIAFSHMATNFYKYIKLYEVNQKRKP